jgi:L-arabinokinase
MVQLDSIRVDIEATLEKIEAICGIREKLVRQESEFLSENGIGAVVADIPGIPIEAAARVGIPSVAVGNFGWDWIYSDYLARDARWASAVEMFREQYGQTGLLLRLPFCEEMSAFTHVEDIPLVATPGTSRRAEIAAITGCDERKKWYLLSFTTLDWDEETLSRVERIQDCEFITVLPLEWHRQNIHPISREQMTFSDVIASSDAVISKPGFGILSDCIVNRKPLIYADRSDFREYPVLEASIRKYMKHTHIPAEKLYSGDLRESLDAIWTRPEPELELKSGGDRIAAERIAGFL